MSRNIYLIQEIHLRCEKVKDQCCFYDKFNSTNENDVLSIENHCLPGIEGIEKYVGFGKVQECKNCTYARCEEWADKCCFYNKATLNKLKPSKN